jgi:hypothetical protein
MAAPGSPSGLYNTALTANGVASPSVTIRHPWWTIKMDANQTTALVETRPLLEWISACLEKADRDPQPEAKAAFRQLAEEFQLLTEEIEGLISTFEALSRRKVAA